MSVTTLHLGILPLSTPDLLAMPGQDPDEGARLFDQLVAECRPRNLVETTWLYDLALMMVRIAYVRKARHSIQTDNFCKSADEIIDPPQGSTEEMLRRMQHFPTAKSPKYNAEQIADLLLLKLELYKANKKSTVSQDKLLVHVTALDLEANYAVYAKFDALEQSLMRERDRIIAQFDRRRREELFVTIAKVENQAGPIIDVSATQPGSATRQ